MTRKTELEKDELIAVLRRLLAAAICHIERMNETATDEAMTPESELKIMRTAIEAEEGKHG
jgi:hypothetical protein